MGNYPGGFYFGQYWGPIPQSVDNPARRPVEMNFVYARHPKKA